MTREDTIKALDLINITISKYIDTAPYSDKVKRDAEQLLSNIAHLVTLDDDEKIRYIDNRFRIWIDEQNNLLERPVAEILGDAFFDSAEIVLKDISK